MKGGRYIKDFSYLGRPMKDVIYIDFSDETAPIHKDNTIIIPEWKGEKGDRELVDLIPFLDHLAKMQGGDIRTELKKYGREGTGQKYNQMQSMMMQSIQRQRESGLSSLLTSKSRGIDGYQAQSINDMSSLGYKRD